MIKLFFLHNFEKIIFLLSRSFRRSDIDSCTIYRHIFFAIFSVQILTCCLFSICIMFYHCCTTVVPYESGLVITLGFVVINKIKLELSWVLIVNKNIILIFIIINNGIIIFIRLFRILYIDYYIAKETIKILAAIFDAICINFLENLRVFSSYSLNSTKDRKWERLIIFEYHYKKLFINCYYYHWFI